MPLSTTELQLLTLSHQALLTEWQRFLIRARSISNSVDNLITVEQFIDRIGEVQNAMMALSEYVHHIK